MTKKICKKCWTAFDCSISQNATRYCPSCQNTKQNVYARERYRAIREGIHVPRKDRRTRKRNKQPAGYFFATREEAEAFLKKPDLSFADKIAVKIDKVQHQKEMVVQEMVAKSKLDIIKQKNLEAVMWDNFQEELSEHYEQQLTQRRCDVCGKSMEGLSPLALRCSKECKKINKSIRQKVYMQKYFIKKKDKRSKYRPQSTTLPKHEMMFSIKTINDLTQLMQSMPLTDRAEKFANVVNSFMLAIQDEIKRVTKVYYTCYKCQSQVLEWTDCGCWMSWEKHQKIKELMS